MPLEPTKLLDTHLDDKYEVASGRVYMNGIQALVRLPMMQRLRDLAAGLNTAGFISGYRGSPLGGVDQAIWKAQKYFDQNHIRFVPGVNEELAATAVWGSQQVNLWPGAKYDGVFAYWYGKGPGVDRCGDVFKHANFAGTSRHGGVLAIAGDDHACKSSTLPHQSDHMFAAAMMPVLNPASVQEYLDLGLHGWALSRYSGCWVGFKALTDTVESSASVEIDPHRVQIIIPSISDFPLPSEGINIRWPDPPLQQEARMQDYKIYAALEYCRQNKLNQIMIDSPRPRFGIIASGKAYLDVRQALDNLGINAGLAAEIGIRLFKVGMTWPLEPEGVRQFAEGLEEILVVEEKRQVIEYQLKEQLYNWRDDVRPRVVGKFDEKGEWVKPHGDWLLPAASELTPAMIGRAIAQRISRFYHSERIEQRLAFLLAQEKALAKPKLTIARVPYYCSGCPHNTSTKVPEGSRAMAGIGCHYMATWITPQTTQTFTQMGGEGVPWIGQAPFTETPHVFANLGDGTYYHSGLLAIRAAVAARVNLTYKILYNDAVAMTGGQPVDGPLTPYDIVQQLTAEGVGQIVVVSDRPEDFAEQAFGAQVPIKHRDEMDHVQRQLREISGVSAIIYVQTCAAEKRRRRKRGKLIDPPVRPFINELVCEGCGDCGKKSNCVSVLPVETEYGRKRMIDQSNCNKDFSCVKGFCPSFVTVEGGKLRKGKGSGDAAWPETLPDPVIPSSAQPYGILITGIGGTGIVTISNILGMAAHISGKGVTVLDMAGLAQKNGAVFSHVRIADQQADLFAVRVAAGEANLVLACDIVVGINNEALSKMQKGLTQAIVNSAAIMPGDFAQKPDMPFPLGSMEQEIQAAVGKEHADFLDATRLATALLGDSIATNLFLVGYAYQKGLLPLSEEALLKAIEINGTAVKANQQALLWGRRAAHNLAQVEKLATPQNAQSESQNLSASPAEVVERRVAFLTAYQNAAYSQRYRDLVTQIQTAESSKTPGQTALSEAVARYYFKLLAIKDEYEVARLHTDGTFLKRLHDTFEGDFRVHLHLAPPLWVKADPNTGEIKKRKYGPWMFSALKILAKLKGLRGTPLDVFSYSAERKMERQLVQDYEALLREILAGLTPHNYGVAVQLASIPEQIRGFGHVKERHLHAAKLAEAELLKQFRSASPSLATLNAAA